MLHNFQIFHQLRVRVRPGIFRVLKSPSKPTPFRIQFYTEEFVTWLKDNHDTRGLMFEECDIDERYFRPND